MDLPPTAIGKDYLGSSLFAKAPSGSGFQFPLFGLLGVTAALEEGFELNILGLSFGIDPKDPALKLPMVGRIGADRRPPQTVTVQPASQPEIAGGKAD